MLALSLSLSLPLSFTGILKFFGHYCQSECSDLSALSSQYPEFLRATLVAVLNPEEDTVWGVAVDTFALLASTVRGRKAMVETCNTEVKAVLKHLGEIISSSRSEVRVRCLQSLAVVFRCEEGMEEDGGAIQNREWFHLISPNLLSLVIRFLKQPFQDLRSAGLSLLLSLAPHEWAQREMQQQPGFVEYLLDRSTDHEKLGKELKYAIIHSLVTSGSSEGVFGSAIHLKFREYVNEGPFYVSTETAVAFEDMQ